jgi:hypothetical protein
VSLLAAVTPHFGHRHPVDADCDESLFDLIEFEGLMIADFFMDS